MVAALREAGRVAKPGAPVVIQVWGRPEACDLDAMKDAVKQFMPPPPPGSAPPAPLWKPGALEAIAEEAGLTPEEAFDHSWAYEFADDDGLARGLLSAALPVIAIVEVGEEPVRAAIIEAMSPYRTESGGYRLENEWHYLIARA